MTNRVRQDPEGRILGALHTHAWLRVVALHAGMSEYDALKLLLRLEKEGRVRKHNNEVWSKRG